MLSSALPGMLSLTSYRLHYADSHISTQLASVLVLLELYYLSEKVFLPVHDVHKLIDFYSARNARIASAVLATAIPSVCPSVSPSVRPSVTCRYCVKTAARSTVQFAPLDSKMCLVL